MRILITGSEGTIGTPLQIELQKRGHEVFGVDIKHSRHKNIQRCDVANYRELREAILAVKPDMVYHLAAEFGRKNGEEFYEKVWQTNVIGTRNILELQVDCRFKLIFASSSEIYGDVKADWIREDTPPGIRTNDYAISKAVNEEQCQNFIARYKSEIMVLRFFNAYGENEYYTPYRSVCALFCYRALKGLEFEVFKNYHRVFMHIDDFIPTLANACERFVSGETINIGGSEYRSVEELAEIVLRETGASRDLLVLLNEDRHNTVNKRPNIDKAIKLLGHNPHVPLEVGIKKTVAWMRKIYD